jgi:hypothetical protein
VTWNGIRSLSLVVLIVWALWVGVVVFLATGFGGGVVPTFTNNLAIWLFALSPLAPLALWLIARWKARH